MPFFNRTGLLVGISCATFFIGLVLGVVMLHFFRRHKHLDQDVNKDLVRHEELEM